MKSRFKLPLVEELAESAFSLALLSSFRRLSIVTVSSANWFSYDSSFFCARSNWVREEDNSVSNWIY